MAEFLIDLPDAVVNGLCGTGEERRSVEEVVTEALALLAWAQQSVERQHVIMAVSKTNQPVERIILSIEDRTPVPKRPPELRLIVTQVSPDKTS